MLNLQVGDEFDWNNCHQEWYRVIKVLGKGFYNLYVFKVAKEKRRWLGYTFLSQYVPDDVVGSLKKCRNNLKDRIKELKDI